MSLSFTKAFRPSVVSTPLGTPSLSSSAAGSRGVNWNVFAVLGQIGFCGACASFTRFTVSVNVVPLGRLDVVSVTMRGSAPSVAAETVCPLLRA